MIPAPGYNPSDEKSPSPLRHQPLSPPPVTAMPEKDLFMVTLTVSLTLQSDHRRGGVVGNT